jgi:hypothetical protein
MAAPANCPSLPEQISWLQERAADAELLRQHFVKVGKIDPDKIERDAAMWRAVLSTLQGLSPK